MKPNPTKLALLVSLLGLGVHSAEHALAEEGADLATRGGTTVTSEQALAIRHALGLADVAVDHQAEAGGQAPMASARPTRAEPPPVVVAPPEERAAAHADIDRTLWLLGLHSARASHFAAVDTAGEVQTGHVARILPRAGQAGAAMASRSRARPAAPAPARESAGHAAAGDDAASTLQAPAVPPELSAWEPEALRQAATAPSPGKLPAPDEHDAQERPIALVPVRQPDDPQSPTLHSTWVPDLGPRPAEPRPEGEEALVTVATEGVPDAADGDEGRLLTHIIVPGAKPVIDTAEPRSLQAAHMVDIDVGQLEPLSPEEQAMQNLAAVLMAEVPDFHASAQPQEQARSASSLTEVRPLARSDRPAPAPATEVVVRPPSDQVLHNLSSVLSPTRSEATRHGADAEPVVVPTQSDKVLHGLSEVLDKDREQASAVAEPAKAAPVEATAEPRRAKMMGVELTAMSDSKLDRMRGGFSLPNGLQISFGIDRAVYVNGNLVATTSLNIVDVAKAVSAAAGNASVNSVTSNGANANSSVTSNGASVISNAVNAALASPANGSSAGTNANGPAVTSTGVTVSSNGGMTVVQSGASNTVVPTGTALSSLGTVIQNSVNDQKIQAMTIVNATVNSLQVMKSMDLQATIRDAVTRALGR